MKKIKISQSFYRVLMSDVLPYEMPMTFTNRFFYNVADRSHFSFNDKGKLKVGKAMKNASYYSYAQNLALLLNGNSVVKTSFKFRINKPEKDKADNYRELTLIHPYMQLKMVDFYKKNKELLLNACDNSSFSIRYPSCVAAFVHKRKIVAPSEVMMHDDYKCKKYPKLFFAYKRYDNINSFLDSREFQKLESRYSYFMKTDIHHCFDNIPRSRLSAALYHLPLFAPSDGRFTDEFARMMGEMTVAGKGILIGPEFSRIYAEIILQQIDRDIELKMTSLGYKIHRDYDCFRYVDDSFIFFNNTKTGNDFLYWQQVFLNKWGLSLNLEKSGITHVLPYENKLSIAKRESNKLIDAMFYNRASSSIGLMNTQHEKFNFPYKIDAKFVIADLKAMKVRNDVEYSKVTSHFLFLLQRRMTKAIDEIDNVLYEYEKADMEELLDDEGRSIYRDYIIDATNFYCQIIDFLFFVFNSDIRMSVSIRILTILDIIVKSVQGRLFNPGFAKNLGRISNEKIKQCLSINLNSTLKAHKINDNNGHEISNLLLLTEEFRQSRIISRKVLKDYMNEEFSKKQGHVDFLMAFNLLEVFNSNTYYYELRQEVMKWLNHRLESKNWDIGDTEVFYIITGLMCSKYVPGVSKDEILRHISKEYQEATKEICKQFSPFVKWENFSLQKACAERIAEEIY